jgi:hypothetical protein
MTFKELLATAHSIEQYNSNNAWGFGGAIGKIYHMPKQRQICVMKAYYRHAPSTGFLRVIDTNGEYIFEDLTDTKSNRNKIIEYFNPKGK